MGAPVGKICHGYTVGISQGGVRAYRLKGLPKKNKGGDVGAVSEGIQRCVGCVHSANYRLVFTIHKVNHS